MTNKKTPCITYGEMSQNLEQNVKSFGLDFYSKCINNTKLNYQNNISKKGKFIKYCLQEFKRPVLFMDTDMQFYNEPVLLKHAHKHVDFMAFNWNAEPRANKKFDWYTFETGGAFLYFNNTRGAFKLLNKWIELLEKNKNKADDRLLPMAFQMIHGPSQLRYYWVPMEYYYIPQYFHLPKNQIVVAHPRPLTDEEDAIQMISKNTNTNRVPLNYDKMITNKVKHHPIIYENKNCPFINECKFRNKKINKTTVPKINNNINIVVKDLKEFDIIMLKNTMIVKNNSLKNYIKNNDITKKNIQFWSFNRIYHQ
jgi:hypothetical protein